MMFKILAVVSLVKICAGHEYVNAHSPHHPANPAVSSQSFVRHDVPLSYKFSAVHVYTTKGPRHYEHRPLKASHHSSGNYKRPTAIQYAPILRDNDVQNVLNNYPSYNARSNHNTENTKLEPKLNSETEQFSHVPRYNAEMLQAVNRYPGHNAVYRSYPKIYPQEKRTKMNYMNQFHVYSKHPEPGRPNFATTPPSQPTPTILDFKPKQHKTQPDSASNNTDKPIEAEETTPYPMPAEMLAIERDILSPIEAQQVYPIHPLTHRMLLNVARAYNIAKLPLKAHSKYAKPKKASHTQMIFQMANTQSDSEANTHLHPIYPLQHRRQNY